MAEDDRPRPASTDHEDSRPNGVDFHMLVESIEDYAIIMLDPAGNVLTWNRGAEIICGYRPDEVIGRHVSCLYVNEEVSAGKPARDLVEAAERGHLEEDGWRLRRDGTRFWTNVVIRAVRDDGRRLRGFIRVARDRTERCKVEQQIVEERIARAEAEATARRLTAIQAVTDASLGALELVPMLQELLARVRAVLAADTATIFLVDPDGAHLTVAAASGLAHEDDAATRVPMGEGFIGQVAAGRVPIVVRDVGESNVMSTILRENIRSLAGAPLLVDGRVIGVLHVGSRATRNFTLEEVTLLGLVACRAAGAIERSRAHTALSESERRFRATFEQAAVGMAHVSCEGRLLLVNDRFCGIVGYSRDELSRMTREELIYPDDRAESIAKGRLLSRGEIDSYTREKRLLRRDGQPVWVDSMASLVRDASGAPDYVAYVIQDISDRKRAEQDRDRLCHELSEALAARDRFLTVASHELKTPLTTLMLQAQLFARSAAGEGCPAGRLAASAAIVLRQTRRLCALVDQLLEVSRAGAGRLPVVLEDVDLAAVVRDAVGSLEEEAAAARTPMRVTGVDGVVKGRWDRARLDQLLRTLLSNAIKYGAGHPVTLGVAASADRVRITVSDGGMGIPTEDQARIFERYERVAWERAPSGFGVGLWIAREIVAALAGTIRVESEPQRGATFIVELPRSDPAKGAAERRPEATPDEAATGRAHHDGG